MIIYDKILSAREYLEIMTGKSYILNADNQLKEVKTILSREFGEEKFKSYPLTQIEKIKNRNVLLVKVVNINDDCEQEDVYLWFEVPDSWSKENIEERM